MNWHLLQISDVLDREFGAALAESVSVLAWEPVMSYFAWAGSESEELNADPPLRVRSFPLQRGYARSPLSALLRLGPSQTRRLIRQCENPRDTPLICTTPYYAPVAEHWPGPVVYYLTDLIASYAGANPALIRRLDARMCRAATVVCPNSRRIASYLIDHAHCEPGKIDIIPNATRESNLLPVPPQEAGPLPSDVEDVRRPVAGVIGNLAGNMDWLLLQAIVEKSPDFSWVFVGPTSMAIKDEAQRRAREAVMVHPKARFTGGKPYRLLAEYARSFDVAVLPYLRREPTYSGSSTRFYEHLAACRPMIATRGFEELLHKEPLLRLVDTASEAVNTLYELKAANFDDGYIGARWLASRDGTWKSRALAMRLALGQRWPEGRSVTLPDRLRAEAV